MSMNKHKIFTFQSNSGRSVDIASSMAHKAELIERPVRERELAPFNGYSSQSYQNNLSSSQVVDFNIEGMIRRICQQELSKANEGDRQKNDISIMKSQVRALKEQYQKMNKLISEEMSFKEITAHIEKKITKYESEAAIKLREVLAEMNDELKRDFHNKFVPLDFLNDLDQQLNKIEEKISLLEVKLKGSSDPTATHSNISVTVAQNLQLKIGKLERETDSLKKGQADDHTHLRELQEKLNTAQVQLDTLDTLRSKIRSSEEEIDSLSNDVQAQTRGLKSVNEEMASLLQKLNLLREDQNGQIIDLREKWAQVSKEVYKRGSLRTQSAGEASKALQQLLQGQTKRVKDKDGILRYQLDSEGYLLDIDGKYIQGDNNEAVRLSEEQVLLLEASNLIES